MSAKPKIFLWCDPLGTGRGRVHGSTPGGDVMGYALAEDGTGLAQHLSISEGFARHDMGLTSEWHHKSYDAHYPGGYDLVWLTYEEREASQPFLSALAINAATVATEEARIK